jgi:hypothetical protein
MGFAEGKKPGIEKEKKNEKVDHGSYGSSYYSAFYRDSMLWRRRCNLWVL